MRGGRAADFEDFGRVPRVDVVAGGGTSVSCEDGEVGAGNGEGGAAVVGVAGKGSDGGFGRREGRESEGWWDLRVEAMLFGVG